ncbi:MAG: ABC transporter ATP-binding protein [Clostridia bacterium]|nr:ABC transporter ATP-binding protein [Clostridia bacterium]
MLKRFAAFYRPHLGLFIADLVCALLLSAINLVYPMITRRMINEFIPGGLVRQLVIFAAILLALYVLKLFLNYFVSYWGHLVGVYMQADMRSKLFDHLQRLPVSFFDDNKTGAMMSRIINDLFEVSELAHHGPEDLFISALLLIGSFILMSSICLPLTLIVFASIPVLVAFAALKRLQMNKAFKAAREQVSVINAGLENSISGIRVSKAYDNREAENRLFGEGNKKFVSARSEAYKHMGQFHAGSTFIGDVLQVIMYISGGLFCMNGSIDFGDLAAFVLYISVFMDPVKRLISFVEQYQDGMTGFSRYCEIMDQPVEEDSPDAEDIRDVRGDIAFDDVSFSYNENTEVLSHLSFVIPSGRTLALVGPSGGGKTTICNLIPRFYEPSSGKITLDGRDVKKITLSSLRKNVGIVSQDVFLFDSTVYDNIAYGCGEVTREQVEAAAKRANIHDFVMSLPDGYETLVGERGVKLSGGQKQRVSIARVFLKDPPVLILDEATSALDNVTEALIQQSLDELTRGRTTLVVAHRLTTVMHADEILVVTSDGIAERGTHAGLLEKDGVYATLWRGAVGAENGKIEIKE